MIRHSKAVLLGVLLLACNAVHAQVAYNVSDGIALGGDFPPGQTLDIALYQSASPVNANIQQTIFAACGIQIPGCNTGPGNATLIGANSDSNVPGVAVGGVLFAGSSGNNAGTRGASASLTLTGTPATSASLQFLTTSVDLQQLLVSYTGTAAAPASVGIDVQYTVSSSILDNSTGTTGAVLPASLAIGSVNVADPATLNNAVLTNGLPTVQSPVVISSVSNTAGSTSSFFNGAAEVSLAVGHVYWSYVSTVELVTLAAGTPADLALTLDSAAAARYELDPTWLADNPQYNASDFSITVATPLPAAAWLMLSGLGAAAAIARRRRTS